MYANSSSAPGTWELRSSITGRSLTNIAVAVNTAGSTVETLLYATVAASKGYFEVKTTSRTNFRVQVRTNGFGAFTVRDYTVEDTSLGTFVVNWTAPYGFQAWFNGTELTPAASTDTGSPATIVGTSEYINSISGFASGAGGFNAIAIFEKTIPGGLAKEISKDIFCLTRNNNLLYFGGGTPTNYPSAADSGSITLTGSAANGVRALAGVAASGSITLTGSAANAVRALAGVAASGSITLTGSNAAALRTWLGVAGAGSITLTGSDAAGVKAGSGAYTSAADAGSITLSGSAAVGTYDRLAAAGAGIITLTGSDASGIRNIPATAEAGSIVLTGSAAVGIRTWLAVAEAGSITLSGSDAEGVYGGAMTLTPADLDAIAAAVWADPAAVAAHAKLDEIIARITC